MKLVMAESMHRPEVLRWQERMVERYAPPSDTLLTLFLPCSARKPYSRSRSHRVFRACLHSAAGKLSQLVHEVTVTSPLGIVPRELEKLYPAAHYEVPVTGSWSREEREVAVRLIKSYMDRSAAPAIGFGEGAYIEVFEEAGVEAVQSLRELENLIKEKLRGRSSGKALNAELRRALAVCDFQFGFGARERLFEGEIEVKGLQIRGAGMLLATFDRRFGYLALSLEGARRLLSLGRYVAELSFDPESDNVFCAGIERADHVIRPRDEVIAVRNGRLAGVGKAVLSGVEMERAEKGLGIILRHRARVESG